MRRLEWRTWLDLPVGLRPVPTATEPALGVCLRHPGLRNPGPYADGTQPGWLVLLGISNPGWVTVHGTDFTAPLAFTFPGRHVLAAQISPRPDTPDRTQASREPAIRVPLERGRGASSHDPARIQFTDHFALHPRDRCTVTVVLIGTPAACSAPVRQEGTLANGKIIACYQ